MDVMATLKTKFDCKEDVANATNAKSNAQETVHLAQGVLKQE